MARAVLALLVAAACGKGSGPGPGPQFTGLVRVSGESPFPESCANVPGGGQGLVHSGGSFLPLFAAAHDGDTGNRTDIYFRPAGAPAIAADSLAQAALSRFRGGRERWRFGTLFK